MTGDQIATAVNEAAILDAEIRAMSKRLAEIKGKLLDEAAKREAEHVAGKTGHGSNWSFTAPSGARVTITYPGKGLASQDEESGAEIKTLAGPAFAKLFERRVSFAPVKAFREVLAALLPKPKAAKVLALVETDSAPKVAFSIVKPEE